MSERMAIHNVNQPGITSDKAMSLMANANVIFCLIIESAFRLSLIVKGSFLRSSPSKPRLQFRVPYQSQLRPWQSRLLKRLVRERH